MESKRNIELAVHVAMLQRQIELIDRLCREGHLVTNGNALRQHLQQLLDELMPATTADGQCERVAGKRRRIARSEAVT